MPFLLTNIKIVAEEILRLMDDVVIPATNKNFIASNFAIKYSCDDGFIRWLLNKTESPVEEVKLSIYDLLIPANISLIIEKLGGREKIVTSVAQIFDLLYRQPNCEKGLLGSSNLFFIYDNNGIFRIFGVTILSGEWYFFIHPPYDEGIKYRRGWRIFAAK